jgi:potassium/hydrogen antiporter
MPVLVLFLGVGMLFGSEGLGGIAFEDYALANSIGSVALAMILFDGGLRTSLDSVRSSWRPALSLSTIGVFLTSLLTGFAAAWILDLPLLHGMLLGSIVGSTDAAAVFSILRTSGLRLPARLTATLEVESGSNDPMAIFLTLGLIALIMGSADSVAGLGILFFLQFGVGGAVGLGIGYLAAWLINRINLDYPGLYPILALSLGLLSFGLAAVLGGSGFLAIYLAGIVLGNSTIVFRNGIFLFHDAGAWLGQMILFIMLGLLSFPSRLAAVSLDGLLLALVLIFAARPDRGADFGLCLPFYSAGDGVPGLGGTQGRRSHYPGHLPASRRHAWQRFAVQRGVFRGPGIGDHPGVVAAPGRQMAAPRQNLRTGDAGHR